MTKSERAVRRELRAMRRYIKYLIDDAEEILEHDPDDARALQQRGIAKNFADNYFDIKEAFDACMKEAKFPWKKSNV